MKNLLLILSLASIMVVAGCIGQTPFGGAGPNCGNSQTEGDETCDPPGKACSRYDPAGVFYVGICSDECECLTPTPQISQCGDNRIDAGEQCDPPGVACLTAGGQAGTCTNQCQCGAVGPPPICGDQNLDAATGEQCDPPGSLCIAADGSTGQCTGQCKCPVAQQGPGPGQPGQVSCSQPGVQACATAADCADNPAPYYCNDGTDERSCQNNCCATKTPACNDQCFTPGVEECDSSYTGPELQCNPGFICQGCICVPSHYT